MVLAQIRMELMIDSNLTAEDFLKWRRSMQWTRSYAAQRLGISYSSVQNYESGRRTDHYKCTVPLCIALGMAALRSGIKPLGGYRQKEKS
jgi:predicted transcriptional regulator